MVKELETAEASPVELAVMVNVPRDKMRRPVKVWMPAEVELVSVPYKVPEEIAKVIE